MRKYFLLLLILLFGTVLFTGCFPSQDKFDDRVIKQRQEENGLDQEELLNDELEDPLKKLNPETYQHLLFLTVS